MNREWIEVLIVLLLSWGAFFVGVIQMGFGREFYFGEKYLLVEASPKVKDPCMNYPEISTVIARLATEIKTAIEEQSSREFVVDKESIGALMSPSMWKRISFWGCVCSNDEKELLFPKEVIDVARDFADEDILSREILLKWDSFTIYKDRDMVGHGKMARLLLIVWLVIRYFHVYPDIHLEDQSSIFARVVIIEAKEKGTAAHHRYVAFVSNPEKIFPGVYKRDDGGFSQKHKGYGYFKSADPYKDFEVSEMDTARKELWKAKTKFTVSPMNMEFRYDSTSGNLHISVEALAETEIGRL